MNISTLNIANILTHSRANGPGERFVTWVQGCPLRCPGCWNPDTWSTKPRQVITSDALAAQIRRTTGIEGITFTGGEPFEQAEQLANVVELLNDTKLSVMIFTGYELHELTHPAQQRLLAQCDIVVAGRYRKEQRTLTEAWRGSSNQTVHFLSDRFSHIPPETVACEVSIDAHGRLSFTGFPPDELRMLHETT